MNLREPSRTPYRVCPSPRLLALLLLPVLAPGESAAAPRPRPSAGVALRFFPEPPLAYLRHIDPVPLRFQPKALPPAPWPELAAASGDSPDLAAADARAAGPETTVPSEPGIVAATSPDPGVSAEETQRPADDETRSLASASPESPSAGPAARTPSAILVDELRPTVRPEDFLPYFILPGASAGEAGATVIVPVPPQPPSPAAQPPSSARFIQTP